MQRTEEEQPKHDFRNVDKTPWGPRNYAAIALLAFLAICVLVFVIHAIYNATKSESFVSNIKQKKKRDYYNMYLKKNSIV